MYVKDQMKVNLVTVKKDYAVSSAIDIMHANKFHRLPVVDDNGRLVGLLTKSTINNNTPNDSSTLSVYELNYLLNKFKVGDIMLKEPISISGEALLEEAASIMLEKEVGCLPVVKDDGTLIGIITYKDIMSIFVDLLGYHQNGTRYVIQLEEDRVGMLNSVSAIMVKKNVSISNMAVYHTVRGIEVVVICTGDNSGECRDALEDAGWNVTSVIQLKNNK